MAEPASAAAPRRLVVVGGGPKALFALEALASRLDPAHRPSLHVTVLDPHERPGPGGAYAPDQPDSVRLNVDAAILDAPASGAAGSFAAWVRAHRPELAEDAYPPRAVVGEYLLERWEHCRERWRDIGPLVHRRGTAVGARRDGEGWRVQVLAPGAAHPEELPCDELLLATGHAGTHRGALAAAWEGPEPLVPAVHPVETMLDPASVPPGARVAVRGAALTFLDAALVLTEGRGGRFDADPRSGALVHRRGADEPATILPTARHGLLLHPKPAPGTSLPRDARAAIDEGRRRLAQARPGAAAASVPQVIGIVEDTAAALLGGAASAREDVVRTLATGREPDLAEGPGSAERALRRAVDVAAGTGVPGPAWALGRAWSGLYPQITRALRGSDAPGPVWQELRDAAQVLERFAFGPPLVTARKLLAMLDSGAVDLSWLEAGTRIGPRRITGVPSGAAAADVVVDAVLAPPGVRRLHDPLLQQLRADGHLHVRPGRRGAVVDLDGTALDTAGRRVDGLVLVGRPTEDHVIGHDTLNRHLHDEIDHWAQRLAGKVREHA